jgi:hypothetical protein
MSRETPTQKPKDRPSGLEIFVKVIIALIVGAVLLTVLVFGTCLLLLRH